MLEEFTSNWLHDLNFICFCSS